MGKGGKGKGKGGKGKGGKGKGKGGDVHIKRLGNKRFFVKGAGLGLDSGDIANLAKDLTGYEGYVCEVVDFSDNHLTDRAVDELVRVLLGVRIEIISFKLFKNKISDAGAKSSEQKRKKQIPVRIDILILFLFPVCGANGRYPYASPRAGGAATPKPRLAIAKSRG